MQLIANNLVKSFGTNLVLNNISLKAESGKAFGLLGRNGAGKTTTIRIIMQVFPSDSGSVTIDGVPVNTEKHKFGYLPEERGLYPKKIILDQLIYLGNLRGMSEKSAKQSAIKLLERLQMSEYTYKKLDTLSKGNQQKIQLVATLVSNPDIVILDEPFSGLDPVNAMLLKDVVKELISDGKIVIFSSHQMSYVEEFCEEIAIIHKGTIAVNGLISDIKRKFSRDKILLKSQEADKITLFVKEKLTDIVKNCYQRNNNLSIELKDEAFKSKLFSAISQNQFDIDEFKVYEPSLNDIFVKYTGDSI